MKLGTNLAFGLLIVFALGTAATGQIGGQTALDGPFMLDDVEDLDLVAGGVDRFWLPDPVHKPGDPGYAPLQAIDPAADGLTLASGQTPLGVLRYGIIESGGFINHGFGVPMPGVPGESTLDFPGDISSFGTLSFLTCHTPDIAGLSFQVILETYPGPSYPQVFWSYTPTPGTTFERVELSLWAPDLVLDAGTLSMKDLLSQTRFLYFYMYAASVAPGATLDVYMDDIKLEPAVSDYTHAGHWALFE